ncbi:MULTISPECIES: ABC transporter permease [Enterococcus]|uniref:ABC transporter permease n=1 Tax=Enterococcus raffinosus TaxID=71452 RepID=A0AAW8TE66_9ENTE|nr:ABC transporter permease [Enterococcus raffinosus]MDT2524905.1 ABC transporter permease [Enterococcus raffinosus]MDT2529990.1 ABC transporter permease [Enterococcus raffinosus]MDT2535563.1 ABC transporter permease [Enterococcus raffinosus]MDT2546089.1 ABC transporter permease [Enterococcus raffinosus]MDT2554955.1 ABC transporter permease [Enterococcus raffinosus]
MNFWSEYGNEILLKFWEHFYLSFLAIFLGILVAVPLGALLTRVEKGSETVIKVVGVFQTIPSLALLSIMIPFFGIGKIPAVIALFLYSLLPILRNTYVGIKSVDATYLDAAKGMGMSQMQRLVQIELPLAIGVIMAGIRVSTVYVISWTTLASYIGAGGLGDFIFNGLNLYRMDLVLMGTIPITLLALLSDALLKRSEAKLTMDRG